MSDFIKKKKFKKNIKIMQENNEKAVEILQYIKTEYLHNTEVYAEVDNIQTHLKNMNNLFKQMEQMK